MKFTVSNHEDDLFEKRQVRLSIDTDRELAGEILEFAYRRYEERDLEYMQSMFSPFVFKSP